MKKRVISKVKKFNPGAKQIISRVAFVMMFAVIGIAALFYAQAAPTAQNIDASIPDPTNVQITELDSTLHVNWTPANYPQATWQLMTVWDGDVLQQSKVASKTATVIQANGVTPGKTYTVKIHTMGQNGRLSPGATVTASARQQSPMPNSSFFDNFNGGHGALDPDLYDVRSTISSEQWDDRQARVEQRMVFNSEHHFHTQLIGGAGVGGITIRPRVPFDFTNRTGTFQFEVDFPPTQRIHGKWMEVVLAEDPITDEHELGDNETGDLSNSIAFSFKDSASGDNRSNVPMITVNINDVETEFKATKSIYSPTNVRLPVVIRVSQNSAELLINGESVATASGFNLPFTKGWWHVVHRNYYAGRGDSAQAGNNQTMPVMGLQLIHWDTIQFDGPNGSYHPVTKAYIQPGCKPVVNLERDDMDDAPECRRVRSTRINVPDSLSDAKTVYILGNGRSGAGGSVTINGHTVPMTTAGDGHGGYFLSLSYAEVPASWLRTGQNDISFSGEGYAQVELEVIFNRKREMPPVQDHAVPMISATGQNFFVERMPDEPSTKTVTTYLYSLGAPVPINYSATASSVTPWLKVSSGGSGTLTSPALGGSLLPITMSIDFSHPILNTENARREGRYGWVKIDGGHMPVYLGVLVKNRTGGSPRVIRSAFPFINVFNRNAIPNYGNTSPATCPPGQFGTPPNCSTPTTPATCPPGHTGTPPNCTNPQPGNNPEVPEPGEETEGPDDPPAQSLSGDLNGDGRVTIVDLSILLSNFGKIVTANQNGDLNGDRAVNISDVLILLSNYGK